MTNSPRFFRKITAAVMSLYLESEDGGDSRLLNYRIDVERIIGLLAPAQQALIFAVHRDGLSDADQYLLERAELRLGRLFANADMTNLKGYFTK